jgi:hypothetical protein
MAACMPATIFTTLKDRKKEIGRDLLAKMCRDLNIDPHEL